MNKFSLKAKIMVVFSFILIVTMFSTQALLILKMMETSYSILLFDSLSLITLAITVILVSREVNAFHKLERMKRKSLEEVLNRSTLVSRANPEGKITHANSRFCDVSGYKLHELLGKDHSILNSKKHSKDFWANMYMSTIKHKAIWNETVTNKNKSGEEYIVDSYISAEFDERGNHIGYMSVRHDLTDFNRTLNKIQNKEQELSAIMSGIDQSSATIEFCTNGFIMNANQKFLELSGYGTLHEITGKHHSIFMHHKEVSMKSYENFWNDLKSGKFKAGEYQKFKKDGKPFWISCTYNPIIDNKGKIIKILKIANDITDSITQKIDLERKNAYLEHAAKILRHDMHSGINTYIPRGISSLERRIKKFSIDNNLKERDIEKIFGTSMKLLKEGLHHSQKVYTGVKEFTNLVKKDSQLEKSKVCLSSVLKGYLKSTAYSSQVMISDLGDEEVNPALFCTAIDNLIRNGLKYNDSDSKLVKIYKQGTSIIVEDNGRGMNKSEFEEYSKPYTRKKENTESGSGLGLNICIAIIKEHSWKLGIVKSKKGTKLKIITDK